MHQKMNVLIFFCMYVQKGQFLIKVKFDHSLVFSCLHLLLSSSSLRPKKKSSFTILFIITTFCTMGPCLFLLEHLSCLSHCKTCWTISMDNVGFLNTSFGDLELHGRSCIISPWCKPKWSHDKFNSQSHIVHGLGTTSWSIM
jgi:predicted metal-binding membrane protein